MSALIHVGKSRTMSPVTGSDGSNPTGLTATSGAPIVATATVNSDDSVTIHAVGPGSTTITYSANGYGSISDGISVPNPPSLVLGTYGPEV